MTSHHCGCVLTGEVLILYITTGGHHPPGLFWTQGSVRWDTPHSFSLQPHTDPINQRQQTEQTTEAEGIKEEKRSFCTAGFLDPQLTPSIRKTKGSREGVTQASYRRVAKAPCEPSLWNNTQTHTPMSSSLINQQHFDCLILKLNFLNKL